MDIQLGFKYVDYHNEMKLKLIINHEVTDGICMWTFKLWHELSNYYLVNVRSMFHFRFDCLQQLEKNEIDSAALLHPRVSLLFSLLLAFLGFL